MTVIKKKLVPTLRFSEFEREWQEKKFGNIFSFYQTNSFSRSLLNYTDGSVKNVHYGDIHTKFNSNFDITKENVPFINKNISLEKVKPESYCKEGDLIIADASEDYKDVGKAIELIKLNDEKILGGLHTYIARDTKGITALGFKGYLMQVHSIRLQIMKFATGISVLGISKGNLAKVEINLPSLAEQQKIASLLTAIDSRIQQLTLKTELLKQYRKGVMQQIFSQQIQFKDDNGKEFPKWEVKKLGEIATKIIQKNKDNKVNFVLTNSAQYGIVSQQNYFEKDIANQNNLGGYYIVRLNDFVYNPRISSFAPVGPIKRNKLALGVMSPLYSVIRFKEYHLDFFEYYFKSTNWHNYMRSIANYGARYDRMNITNKDFLKMPLPIPSIPEQQKIANFLIAIDEKISLSKAELDKMQAYKKGLLQQMFV